MLDTSSYLDPWEGNSRGGVGANHQGDEGGTQVPEHAGQLEREETETLNSTALQSVLIVHFDK